MFNRFNGLRYSDSATPANKPLPVGKRPTEASLRALRMNAHGERVNAGNALVTAYRAKQA